mmetsp:Transcript_14141/g.17336  ORF Transcript_14141/g.17336 Transcript_14141/m.17336 type:complete len:301 (-) Transcript_14141:2406-3308(-)
MELHTPPPGELCAPMPSVHIGRQITQHPPTRQSGWQTLHPQTRRQQPVHAHIRVPSDGGREMRVHRRRQSVVVPFLRPNVTAPEILGGGHAPCRQDPEEFINVGIGWVDGRVERIGEGFGGGDVDLELAAGFGLGDQSFKHGAVGGGMTTEDGQGGIMPQDLLPHGDVGQQHEFFHKSVGFEEGVGLDVGGVVVPIIVLEHELHLGRGEGESSRSDAFGTEDPREFGEALHRLRGDGGIGVPRIDVGLGLSVGESGDGMDEALGEGHVDNGCLFVIFHLPEHRKGVPVDIPPQTAQIGGE